MKKVFQTMNVDHSKPISDTNRGNCLAACVASILEVPIELISHNYLSYAGDDEKWLEVFNNDFIREHNHFLLITTVEDNYKPLGLYIQIVENDSGITHALVADNGNIVHDPKEGNKIDKYSKDKYREVIYIIPNNYISNHTVISKEPSMEELLQEVSDSQWDELVKEKMKENN